MQNTSFLTHEAAVARARALAVAVGERAVAAEAARCQPGDTMDDMIHAGLVRLLVPRRWGGHELSFDALVDSVMEIAKVDASAGWCCAFLMVHSWLLARFPDKAQQDVWETGPDVPLAVSIIPVGQPTPMEGGYLLSGSWPFVSGVDHCEWSMLMGKILLAGGATEMRYFLVPKRDYQVRDTWFTYGLKASGSNTVTITDAFVPDHRTVALSDLLVPGQAPGAILNTGALYQIPVPEAFPLPLVAALIGAAKGAYETGRGHFSLAHAALTQERIAEKTHVQIRLAGVYEEIVAAECLLHHILRLVREAGPWSMRTRSETRLHYATIAQRCRAVVETLYTSCGGGANTIGHPIGRFWVDIHAMAAHARLHFDSAGEGFGRVELGVPANPHDPYAAS